MTADPIQMPSAPTESAADRFGSWGHDPHVHDFHQFIHVPAGHAVVEVAGRVHHLGPAVGLWVPAGVVHAARFDDDCLPAPLGFEADLFRLPFDTCTEVPLTPTRRRLLLRQWREGLDGAGPSFDLFDALVGTSSALPLPEPRTPAARAVARDLATTPADQRTIPEWAAEHYVSATSLRRAFQAETGLSFSQWRTRARLNASVELLERGQLVSLVAQRVGFTSTNGFILAFRRHFGQTPKAYATRQGREAC